jgi:hypothetical protein
MLQTTFNEGQSMILYDGTLSNVFCNQNKEKLYYGIVNQF